MRYNNFKILIPLLFLTACMHESPDIREDMVEAALKERLENFEKKAWETCTQSAMQIAGNLVDSILIARARLVKDTIGKPPRPDKPELPEVMEAADSVLLQPLFNKDSADGR